MATIDLTAASRARQAEREKSGAEQHVIKFKDWKAKLPFELPGEYAFAMAEGDLASAFKSVVGDKSFEDFRQLAPSTDDLKAFTKAINDLYGFDEGESEPSDAS
jgi:hypothetical protein